MAPPNLENENEEGIDMTEINIAASSSSPPNLDNGVEQVYHQTTAGSVIPIAPRRTGMYVTARNLTMTVGSEKKNTVKNILSDLNFFLKPGSMVLILGSPGCGKSSVMKALACQTHDERLSGKLLFNGKEANPETHHRDVIYVVQEDHHMAPFTVKETFKFSADMQMPEGTTEEQKNERVDTILKMLGLEAQADTVVGNEFLRGISGGQKKRVTIGVEFVKDANLILLDEVSTGLDSTTTLDLITNVKEIVTTQNVSCIVSLLQPGSEIVRLFDFLMVLSEGHMTYFGPMNSGIDYFEELGFKLPLHHNPAEFFQEIVDEPELYYAASQEKGEHPPLKGTQQFAQAYKNSEIYRKICEDLDNNVPNPADFKDSSHLTTYPTSTAYQIRKTSMRAFKMLISHPVVVRVRIIKSIVMGLILGSLFWDLAADQSGGNNRSGLIFFSLLFVIFGGFGSITVLFEQRSIFYIQKDGKYYNTFSFFLSLIFSELPISAAETVIFSVLVYWMCGLQANAERFIYFILMVLASDLSSQSFFKMVSSFSPNATMASVIGPAFIAPFILFAGFMIYRTSIPGWWIWMYWISPIHYGFEGLMSNEHYGLDYHCTPSEMVPPPFIPNFTEPYPYGFGGQQVCPHSEGVQFLKVLGMQENNWFKWVDLAVVLAYAIIYSCLMYFFLSKIHYDSRLANPATEKRNSKRAKKAQKIQSLTTSQDTNVNIGGAGRQELTQSKLGASSAKKDIPIGCYVQWKNLCYDVDVKKDGKKKKLRLLNNINGYVKPGMLLALMGPSGAGKSTLLDVLANRKTGGHTKGDILINGTQRTRYFTRISAYVEQIDILPPTQTVREAVQFSAKARLPESMPLQEKMAFVENILETLNLMKIANRLIGEGVNALSLSQRKRVNIAIELASDPQLLFLDEPTSGLDSSSALKVMNLIKKIASSGRSVICTIHQPSTSIFKKFDHLLLLKKGGETVYFGPTGEDSNIVLDYFAKRGLNCDPLKNPADFILDVTDEEIDLGNGNVFRPVQSFEESELNAKLNATIDAGIMPVGTHVPVFHGVYSSTMKTQWIELFKRGYYAQVRRVQNLRTRIMRSIILGIVFGTLFLQLGNEQQDIYSRTSLLFFSLVFGGMSSTSTIPLIATERGVFYREQSSGMYRIWIYMVTFIVADLPFVFLSALAYTIPAYFISGLNLSPNGQPFFFNVLITFIVYFCYQMIAMLFACIFPTVELASGLIGVILSLTALFAGFMIPSPSIPKGWKWAHQIDFITYMLESVLVNEFENLDFECPDHKGAVPIKVNDINGDPNIQWFCPVTKGSQVLQSVDYKIDDKFSNIAIGWGFGIFFIILIYIALRFIRHQVK